VTKTTTSVAQLANCIWLHAYSRSTTALRCASASRNCIYLIERV